MVHNMEVDGRMDFHGPAIFVSLDGTWMHIDVARGEQDKYGGLLSHNNFRQLRNNLYTLDAVVFITGPPRSYGKLVKDVLVVDRASFQTVVDLYEGFFEPSASPAQQDYSKHIDWCRPAYIYSRVTGYSLKFSNCTWGTRTSCQLAACIILRTFQTCPSIRVWVIMCV